MGIWKRFRDVFVIVFLLVVATVFAFIPKGGKEAPVRFSVGTGVYSEELNVELSAGGRIFYNLSGDDLEEDKKEYEGAIKLSLPDFGYKVYTISAKYCNDDNKCSDTYISTYLLGKNLDEDLDIDVISVTSAQKGLYDYEKGIMVPGKVHDEAIALGDDGITMGNYRMRGDKWIRNAHVVTFSNKEVVMDDNVGLQISGGTSSAMETKSFVITGDIRYDFGDGVDSYDGIRLRAGGQDHNSGNIRSSVASRLAEESGFISAKTKRAVVFLNNVFYGVFDIQQNYSVSNIAKMFDLSSSKCVKTYKGGEGRALQEGGVYDLLNADLTVEDNREIVENYVDMDNYLMYYALQALWNNTDWPVTNFEMWACDNKSDRPYEDGKARFLIYDVDVMYYKKGNKEYFDSILGDQLSALMVKGSNKAEGTLFRNVMKSPIYKNRFAELIKRLTNTSFSTENILRIIDEEKAKIDHQMRLFYSEAEYEEWQGWIDLMKEAVVEREEVIRKDISKYL